MDWNAIRAEYLAGGTSYRKLAEKHQIPLKTIEHRGKKEGWTKQKERLQGKIRAKTENDVVKNTTKKTVKINTVADKMLERLLNIAESQGFNDFSPKDIKEMTVALKNIKDIKGEKSALDTQEQKARIKNLEKQAKSGVQIDENSYGIAKIPEIVPLIPPPIEDSDDE